MIHADGERATLPKRPDSVEHRERRAAAPHGIDSPEEGRPRSPKGGVRRRSRAAVAIERRCVESGVPDVVNVDPRVAPNRLFEGEHDRHPIDRPGHARRASSSPRPNLGGHAPQDGNPARAKAGRQSKVVLGVVHQRGRARRRDSDATHDARE